MLISKLGIPRLSPVTVTRERLGDWLDAYTHMPVRLLLAPAGSGKTTLLVRYALDSERAIAYCDLPPACSLPQFYAAVANSLNQPVPDEYAGLLQMLADQPPSQCFELIVDNADNGCTQVLAELHRLIEDAPANVALIFAARSRERIGSSKLSARGVAAVCDAARFFFSSEECMLLAQSFGVETGEDEARRFCENTDGWALAVAQAIAVSAAERVRLDRGFASWKAQNQSFLRDYIGLQLQSVDEDDASTFEEFRSSGQRGDPARMNKLQARGLFVIEEPGGLWRTFRALRPPAAQTAGNAAANADVPPIMVKMFRSFEASIGGREIPWVRRRDQDIVKYLLLKPGGRATRADVAATFWGDTDRHLATQSVRTACSTIRKAIGSVVGPGDVDLYFRTSPDLQIDLTHVVCDAHRFSTHLKDAESCLGFGDVQGAAMHLRAADKLHTGDLLEFEVPRPWFQEQADALRERHLTALEYLANLALECDGDYNKARQYALRAQTQAADRPALSKLLQRLAFLTPAARAAELQRV